MNDGFPFWGKDIVSDHAKRSKREADGKAQHNKRTVKELHDKITGRNADGPEHQQIDDGRVFYESHAIDKTHDAVEQGIHPLR